MASAAYTGLIGPGIKDSENTQLISCLREALSITSTQLIRAAEVDDPALIENYNEVYAKIRDALTTLGSDVSSVASSSPRSPKEARVMTTLGGTPGVNREPSGSTVPELPISVLQNPLTMHALSMIRAVGGLEKSASAGAGKRL